MRTKYFIIAIFMLLLVPALARAVSQDTIDRYIFLLQQPEWNEWGEGAFSDTDLLEGLDAIYTQATADGDDVLLRRVIWAMGETGLVGFTATVITTLDVEPVVSCFALGKLPSVESSEALVGMLDNDDMQVRDAAVWGLGKMTWIDGMEDARDSALEALNTQLATEEEDWVADDIRAAITLIETGLISSEMFMEESEPM